MNARKENTHFSWDTVANQKVIPAQKQYLRSWH